MFGTWGFVEFFVGVEFAGVCGLGLLCEFVWDICEFARNVEFWGLGKSFAFCLFCSFCEFFGVVWVFWTFAWVWFVGKLSAFGVLWAFENLSVFKFKGFSAPFKIVLNGFWGSENSHSIHPYSHFFHSTFSAILCPL